jgi:origin recognition complex subunit 6
MPTIRDLVKTFSYPNAAPHIYTGVEIIIPLLARMSAVAAETPSKRARRAAATSQGLTADLSDARVLGLLAVVLFYVLSRMMDRDITPEQYTEWRDKALATLLQSPMGSDTTAVEIETEINQLMPMAQEEGWLQMEWFLNVAPPANGEDMEGVEMTGEVVGATTGTNKSLQGGDSDYIGLGTMMQDATDYLGARQRNDYQRWKAGIIARVEAIEAS